MLTSESCTSDAEVEQGACLPMIDSCQLGCSREGAIAGRSHTGHELQHYCGRIDLEGVILWHVALHCVCGAVQLSNTRHRTSTCITARMQVYVQVYVRAGCTVCAVCAQPDARTCIGWCAAAQLHSKHSTRTSTLLLSGRVRQYVCSNVTDMTQAHGMKPHISMSTI